MRRRKRSLEELRRRAWSLEQVLPELDDLVHLAATVAGTSSAAVNLVSEFRQQSIAAYGADRAVCDLEDSMCRHSVAEHGVITVPDARLDDRFASSGWVDGRLGNVRFYSAQPLVGPDGRAYGTLCVFDDRVLEIDDDVEARLRLVADHVQRLLAVGHHAGDLEAMLDAAEQLESDDEGHLTHVLHHTVPDEGLAGRIADDLWAPLTNARLAAEMLGADQVVQENPVAAVLVDSLLTSTRRVDATVQGLLAVTTLDRPVAWQPVDLADLVALAADDLGPLLDHVDLATGSLPEVLGDPDQLRLLLGHLLRNAAAATRDRAPARLGLTGGFDEGAAGHGSWWLEVTDNGPGIADGLHDTVFHPLVRGPGATGGLGLGLTACRRIALNHGGTMSVRQADDGGAVLRLEVRPPAT